MRYFVACEKRDLLSGIMVELSLPISLNVLEVVPSSNNVVNKLKNTF